MPKHEDEPLFIGMDAEPVRSLMHPTVVTCGPATPVADAAALMAQNKCGSIIVTHSGQTLGIWTEMDALHLELDRPEVFDQPISLFMNAPIISISGDASLEDAAMMFREHGIRHLLVIDGGGMMIGVISQTDVVLKLGVQAYLSFRVVGSVAFRPALTLPHDIGVAETIGHLCRNAADAALVAENGEVVGIITERDVVRLIARRAGNVRIGDVASRPIVSIAIDAPLLEARNLLKARRFRHLVIIDSGGEVHGILTMADILAAMEHSYVRHLEEVLTHRSRQLAAAERRLDLILQSAGDSVVGLNTADEVMFVNAAALELLGWQQEAILGRNWHDAACRTCDGQPCREETCPVTGAWRTEGGRRMDGCTFARWDGSLFPAEISVSPLTENDRRIGAVLVFRDITARKAAEQALREERDFTKAVIESLPGIFYVIDETGRIELWNDNFEAVTGYGAEEIRSLRPADFFPESETIPMAERLGHAFATGHGRIESDLVTRDGRHIPYYFTGSCMASSTGRKLIGTGVDIAARRKMEEMLRRSNQDLEAFAYVASHDLRQPLRMVRSYLQLLERHIGDVLDKDSRDYMAFAVDGAVRMDRLIVDLLAYSRVGRTTTPLQNLDMRSVVEEALGMLAPSISECGATIAVSTPIWPHVSADRDEMLRLWQNLIDNSLKYRSPDRAPSISLSCSQQGQWWVFAVRDNGIGIASDQFERIFGIFQRLHGSGEYEGSGIGLAICKKIVEHHDGRIWVESMPGEGSTFYFKIAGEKTTCVLQGNRVKDMVPNMEKNPLPLDGGGSGWG